MRRAGRLSADEMMSEHGMLKGSMILLFVFAQAAVARPQESEPPVKPCRAQPSLVGKCFRVRGRLSLYNGAPTFRLWRAGTKRMLGVSASYATAGYSSIPAALEKQLDWETELWGTFLVCPFTQRRPQHMQMICIEAADHVVARKRP